MEELYQSIVSEAETPSTTTVSLLPSSFSSSSSSSSSPSSTTFRPSLQELAEFLQLCRGFAMTKKKRRRLIEEEQKRKNRKKKQQKKTKKKSSQSHVLDVSSDSLALIPQLKGFVFRNRGVKVCSVCGFTVSLKPASNSIKMESHKCQSTTTPNSSSSSSSLLLGSSESDLSTRSDIALSLLQLLHNEPIRSQSSLLSSQSQLPSSTSIPSGCEDRPISVLSLSSKGGRPPVDRMLSYFLESIGKGPKKDGWTTFSHPFYWSSQHLRVGIETVFKSWLVGNKLQCISSSSILSQEEESKIKPEIRYYYQVYQATIGEEEKGILELRFRSISYGTQPSTVHLSERYPRCDYPFGS